MTETRQQRKLAAILAADVVGFSRLMEADEAGTLARLKATRKDVLDPNVEEFGGRIVKTTGDGALIEFPSAVDAVLCAIAMQNGLAARDDGAAEDQPLQFRMGVNLGDIIIDGDDIYGDGVNVAARLEAAAEPGGVCISGVVYDQTAGKIEARFADGGEQALKNIDKPVRVWRWHADAAAAKCKADAPAGPDRLSIAVLPLDNMSGDPEQEYFADGITEDIITELSRFRELFVIARNSVFTYKGKAVNIQEVGRELGVQYVVEGSVRKSGNRVRITAQLIDARNGSHLWADKFDRNLDDIFAVQDEITQIIVATLPGRLAAARLERVKQTPTDSMTAYEYMLRGRTHHYRGTREDNEKAIACIEKAVEIDPGYAQAWAELACVRGQAYARGFRNPDEIVPLIVEAAERAQELDDNESECHRMLCEISLFWKDFDKARYHHERALALNPNDPRITSQRGDLLTWQGDPEAGLEWLERTNRLDPYHPDGRAFSTGRALFTARRYADAMAAFKRIAAPQAPQHGFMAACAAHMGDTSAAEAHAEAVRRLRPGVTIGRILETTHCEREEDLRHFRDGLAGAGLPE